MSINWKPFNVFQSNTAIISSIWPQCRLIMILDQPEPSKCPLEGHRLPKIWIYSLQGIRDDIRAMSPDYLFYDCHFVWWPPLVCYSWLIIRYTDQVNVSQVSLSSNTERQHHPIKQQSATHVFIWLLSSHEKSFLLKHLYKNIVIEWWTSEDVNYRNWCFWGNNM